MARHASQKALEVLSLRRIEDPLAIRFGPSVVFCTRRIMSGAKCRCDNKRNNGYVNYGARGIKFLFPNVRTATVWVLENLGPRPTTTHSIDRIDNNKHYEPGNLRWATHTEQARNKRAYKRSEMGERIRKLQTLRSDLTYETIRQWIKQGATDEDILQRRKHAGCGVRHQKLRA